MKRIAVSIAVAAIVFAASAANAGFPMDLDTMASSLCASGETKFSTDQDDYMTFGYVENSYQARWVFYGVLAEEIADDDMDQIKMYFGIVGGDAVSGYPEFQLTIEKCEIMDKESGAFRCYTPKFRTDDIEEEVIPITAAANLLKLDVAYIKFKFTSCTAAFNSKELIEASLWTDSDNDHVPLALDNCSTVINFSQANSDADSLGDMCDNCDYVDNEDQADMDLDLKGDACDPCPSNADDSVCGPLDDDEDDGDDSGDEGDDSGGDSDQTQAPDLSGWWNGGSGGADGDSGTGTVSSGCGMVPAGQFDITFLLMFVALIPMAARRR